MMFTSVLLLAVASTTVPLRIGDTLPVVVGETLSGKGLALPSAAGGKPAIVVCSFSRAGGNDARRWTDRLSIEAADKARLPSFVVMMLESVPRILRGMVSASIRKQMAPATYERSIVVLRDEAIWKQRLAASDDRRAYVLLIDSKAQISWMNSGPFSEAAFEQLRKAVLRVHPPRI